MGYHMNPQNDEGKPAVGNPNHPKEGSSTRVEPIRDPKHIWAIKKLLADNPRNLLLFTMGINNGLRTGDLLKLQVGQVRYVKPGEYVTIRESKTGKENTLMINKAVHRALAEYLENEKPDDEDCLFASRKGGGPITIQRVNALVKEWTRAINLKGNYGAHSLRKTFGFVHRIKYGVGFEVLAKRFNHSSPAVTMRYLGIADKEVNGILLNEI
jgi:integrase